LNVQILGTCPKLVISFLTEHSQRWRFLHLESADTLFDILSPIQGRLSQLESLHVSGLYGPPTNASVFENAPRLHRLIMDCRPPIEVLRLPWSQLKHIHSGATRTNEALFILGRCTNLSECVFKSLDARGSHPSLIGTSSNLLSLALSFHSMDGQLAATLHVFFGALTLPCLKSLEITDLSDDDRWPSAPFISLMSRSSCPLETLILNNVKVTDNDMLHCLQHTPHLRSLTLEDKQSSNFLRFYSDGELFTDHFLHGLTSQCVDTGTSDSPVPCLVPKLENLILSGDTAFDAMSLVTMISFRLRSIQPLKCIHLSLSRSYRTFDAGAEQHFHDFQERGLIMSGRMGRFNFA